MCLRRILCEIYLKKIFTTKVKHPFKYEYILNSNYFNSLFHFDFFRQKERSELVRVSAAVMGIEFSYAAETAFVSPTLLKIGVNHQQMTLVWALSPLVGFFVTPVLGSISDKCRLPLGRRRPFIILLSIGVFLGIAIPFLTVILIPF